AGSEALWRGGRGVDALCWALGGLGIGLAALVLVTLAGLAHPGRSALVHLLLGTTLLASVIRWRSTSLAAVGHCLLLAGTVWLLAWLAPGRPAGWGLVLAGETLLLATLAALRKPEGRWHSVLTAPCHGLTHWAGLLTLV